MHSVITFLLLITISVAFLILGLIIVFRPDIYSRWVHSSPGFRTTWLHRGWAEDEHYSWRVKIVGGGFAVGGILFVILSIWVYWFQQ
jgi:hypothetical protein